MIVNNRKGNNIAKYITKIVGKIESKVLLGKDRWMGVITIGLLSTILSLKKGLDL